MNDLPARIRAAAKRQKIGVDALRLRAKMSGGTFYGLLRGDPPKTFKSIQKLQKAGVEIPANLFRKAA
jgi:hypothetical protein